MKDFTLYFGITAFLSFLLTALFTRRLIPVLKSKKMGQKILEIGPRWHKSKEGTPTMGGLSFYCVVTLLSAAAFAVLYFCGYQDKKALLAGVLTLFLAASNGAVGMIDDGQKLRKKENEGLTAPQKYVLQLICASLYLAGMKAAGLIDGTLRIPFADVTLDLGFFYFFLALILITGIVNSVNLTDGIDGLLSMISLVVAAFLIVIGYRLRHLPLVILASGALGGALGFLVYNYHPARVFMGDTGSLFFGGLFAGAAFMTGQPFLILLYGVVFICESFSVILQVGCYKLTKKRIFKMSPIHHHFEMSGWGELKIGYVFSFVTLLACVLSYFAF